MMETKWTPGPWEVHLGDNNVVDKNEWKPVTEVRQVAAGGVFGDYHEVICCNTSYYPTELDPKNAHLIAAAPCLYEALGPFGEHAEDRVADDLAWQDSDTVQIVVRIDDLRKALAALRKARGEA